MTTQAQARKVQLQADKINSTWWWEIELDPTHKRNYNPNVTHLYGYSKFQGHDEAQDKDQMLMRKIVMLATNGYLNRSRQITVYRRGTNLINKQADPIVCVLYAGDFGIPANQVGNFPALVSFLRKLYDQLLAGGDVKYLLPKVTATYSKDEIFDITRHKFPSQGHLYAWAEQKIKDGHSYVQVQNFVVKYLERKPFMTNEKLPPLG